MRRATTTLTVALCLGLTAIAWADGGTAVLRLTRGDHAFQVTLEPAHPAADHRVDVTLDLNEIPKVPDPTYGNRVPVTGASLVAVVNAPGHGGTVRYTMHPAGGEGAYGFHWTPPSKGLYTLGFERRDGDIPEASFQIGVGIATPSQGGGGAGAKTSAPGAVTGPLMPKSAGPTAGELMKPMTDPAGFLGDALESRRPNKAEVESALTKLSAQAKKLPGTCPDDYHVAATGYDALAHALQKHLAQLSLAARAGKMRVVRREWKDTLANTCTKCHVKFWWAITGNLDSWPKVTATQWRR